MYIHINCRSQFQLQLQRELTALTKFEQFQDAEQEWDVLGGKILKLAALEAKSNMSLKAVIEQHQSELETMDEGKVHTLRT